jgi:hypothetical protein
MVAFAVVAAICSHAASGRPSSEARSSGQPSVQASTKYELVINLEAARALGLDLPPTLRGGAAAVVE